MSKNIQHIILIVPCYNEEKNLTLFAAAAETHLQDFSWDILFVNDGSSDDSWNIIRAMRDRDKRIHGINFARNFGHQNALKAGLEEASAHFAADAYVTLDADLQHPLELIPQMIKNMENTRTHIVQALREDKGRKISCFKILTSRLFYSVFSWLSGIRMLPGMSDFRVIDRHTLEFVVRANEKDLFLRGLLPWSGLSTVMFPYLPGERQNGVSQYTLKKMIALSLSGIVGYSARPLNLAIILGLVAIILALGYFIYVIVVYASGAHVEIGWPSLIGTMLAMGGVQLLIMGIMGLYLGKLFVESKNRPSYVIGDKTT